MPLMDGEDDQQAPPQQAPLGHFVFTMIENRGIEKRDVHVRIEAGGIFIWSRSDPDQDDGEFVSHDFVAQEEGRSVGWGRRSYLKGTPPAFLKDENKVLLNITKD